MADLSVAHLAALAHLVESVPDRTLRQLTLAVGGMPGDRARTLETMLMQAGLDRTRRARGMAALAPMFRARPDGVAATTFPPQVLPRLWKFVAVAQADLLDYLDPPSDYVDDTHRLSTVCARLFASAAAAVRDKPDDCWPPSLDAAAREAGLEALAHACDLGGLAHRALPSLKAWTGRPDADQIAEFRLMLRDAAAISESGARDLLEILFAHLTRAPRLLRLLANSSHAAARDGFLSGSELATFVDRLIVAGEIRARRIADYKAGDPIEPLQADLEWVADFLTETDTTVPIQAKSPWGVRIRQIRIGVSRTLGSLLGRVGRTVDKVLPMASVQTVGRMKREIPRLDAPIEAEGRALAESALDLVRVTRSLAAPFGCDGQRMGLMSELMDQFIGYADLALEEINAGVVSNEALAAERVMMAADFMERIEAVPDARAVRRRVAVSGVPASGVSPKAA
ncbi:hypothetical protein BH09PSE1_BH09PSE1_18160 [soil metagenome]